jgi:hypothetical protein
MALSAEGLSLRGIASHLNGEGVTTSAGAQWQAEKVSRVLKSPRARAMASQAPGV